MRSDLPTGTVTFLFTDVEGSTKLLRELGAEAYSEALAEHRRIVRGACAAHDGVEVDTQGDAFFLVFPSALGALAAAQAVKDALAPGPIHLRIGLHTGTPLMTEEGYVGDDVHLASRVAAAAHGGQVVLSRATRELVDGLLLVDLGEHRLKDIDGAVPIYQLGEESFPPLKTISNTNLPRPASSFIGRERELSEVLARFERGTRLLTLTGPGGSGKTRLAVEAAASLVPAYKAGVFWIGLAPLRDSALVTEQIAQALGARDGLAGHIGEREMLLLLDNLEQVIEAAPELSALLQTCPNLSLLCTSRELLRVQGEVEYSVPPLASSEAVALFCERSGLEPSAEIAELCTRLDALPLAVELAAARTKALSVGDISERLSGRLDLLKGGRDADPRQQTLRATIEWSYDLLSAEEQPLFARLSVFARGCTLDAAQEICEAHLDTLQSLVEKSLVRFSDGRYWMLETIREYATEVLARIGSASDVRRRHATYFARLAQEEGWRYQKADQADAIRSLTLEESNLRLALSHAARHDPDRLLQMVSSLMLYWTVAGSVGETRAWAERALASGAAEDSVLRADALVFLAGVSCRSGDPVQGIAQAEEAVLMYTRLGSDRLSRALEYLGNAHSLVGNYGQAIDAYRQAIAEAVRTNDLHRRASATGNLGYLMLQQGDFARAKDLFEDSADLAHELGRDVDESVAITNAGLAALRSGRVADACNLLKTAVRRSLELGHTSLVVSCLEGFAAIAVASADYERAATLQGAAAARLAETGMTLDSVEKSLHNETELAIEVAVRAGLEQYLTAGSRLTLDEAVEYALAPID